MGKTKLVQSGVGIVIVLVGLSAACSRPHGASAPQEPLEPSAGAAVPADSTVSLVVRNWVAGCSDGDDLWKWRESATVWCDELGAALEGSEGSLDWRVYMAAEQVDALVVEGKALDEVEMELWWAASEAPFAAERSVAADAQRSDSREVRFELVSLPGWEGELRRFRVTWHGGPSPLTRVTGARVVKRFAGDSKPAAATGF